MINDIPPDRMDEITAGDAQFQTPCRGSRRTSTSSTSTTTSSCLKDLRVRLAFDPTIDKEKMLLQGALWGGQGALLPPRPAT